jgi:phospholipase C
MPARIRLTRSAVIVAAASIAGLGVALAPALASPVRAVHHGSAGGLSVRPGAIKHVIVIELENESFGETFGPA